MSFDPICENCQFKNLGAVKEPVLSKKAGMQHPFTCTRCKFENKVVLPLKEKPSKKNESNEPGILGTVVLGIIQGTENQFPYFKVIANKFHNEQNIELKPGKWVLGRIDFNSTNLEGKLNISTKDEHMSREHLKLDILHVKNGWRIQVTNLGRNGTFINKDAQGNADLKEGQCYEFKLNDFVTIGNSKIELHFRETE